MLDEAISIFSNLKHEKGMLKARLEKAQMQYLLNLVEQAQERALLIESDFKERDMYVELVEAGVLVARIYRKLHEYELAEKKLKDLFFLAHYQGLEQEHIVAEALYQMGLVYYATNREGKALDYFRRSAKTGMVLGVKSSIIKPFNAARKIDKYKARDLLSSDLVYRDSMFVKTKMERTVNPFSTARTKVKLCATTMFVDIVGFSSLMKRSDEDMTVSIIDELIDRLCQIIYQHNGYIDKFLGDGFMAIFEHGHGLKFESAFNALKSGVDIYRALKHKNRKLKKAYGVDSNINVRMGVSTGEIYALLLGNFIKTEFTYLGNSVNLASKLESQASNQLMLIDEDTYNMVKDMIVSDPKHLSIQGMGEVTAYKVFRLARKQRRGATTARMSPDKLKTIMSSDPDL
jgi:class 3 adenylate cyclase